MSDDEEVADAEKLIEELVDESVWTCFDGEVSDQRSAFFVFHLLPSTTPAQLRLSVQGMVDYRGVDVLRRDDADYGTLHLFWTSSSSSSISIPSFIRSSLHIQSYLGTLNRIHLEDFPTSFLDEFVPWFEASRAGIPSVRRQIQV